LKSVGEEHRSFSDKDKRILIEVVNHIHHAYASDQAFKESETTSITLPARLVRLSADVVGQSYRPEILSGLEKAEIELLLTSLFKSIDAMTTALEAVITALPGESPAWVRDQFDQQLQSIAALTALKSDAQAVPATRPLIESGKETPSEKPEPADLHQRYEELSQAQEALSPIDLEKLKTSLSWRRRLDHDDRKRKSCSERSRIRPWSSRNLPTLSRKLNRYFKFTT
jgi:hypothetical protein